MKYAKRLNIVRRRIKIRKEYVKDEMHDYVHVLASRLKLRGFARYVKNHWHVEIEGTETLIQEFLQTYSAEYAMEYESGVDIEQVPLIGEVGFELIGIDSEK